MTALVLLHASALLALRDDEPGAYQVWKDEGEPAGRLAHEQLLALPQEWLG